MDIEVASAAFHEGDAIPVQYTCDGENVSPPLRWGRLPKDSQSLALICEDPDAPSGIFVHWLIFNLPPIVSDLPEAMPTYEARVRARYRRAYFGGRPFDGDLSARSGNGCWILKESLYTGNESDCSIVTHDICGDAPEARSKNRMRID